MSPTAKEIHLFEAYLQLAAREGVANITLQKIAREAKVSYGKVHFYFNGKNESVFLALIEYVAGCAQDFAKNYTEKHSSPVGLLGRYIDITFDWSKVMPHHASFWLYFYYSASIKGTVRRKHPKVLDIGRERILKFIQNDDRIGNLRTNADNRKLAGYVHSILVGNLVLSVTDNRSGSFEFYRSQTHALVRAVIYGH